MVILDFHTRTSILESRKFEIVYLTSARPGPMTMEPWGSYSCVSWKISCSPLNASVTQTPVTVHAGMTTIKSRTVGMRLFNTCGRRIGNLEGTLCDVPQIQTRRLGAEEYNRREGEVAEISIRAYLCHFFCHTPLMLFADLLDIGRWEVMYHFGNVRVMEKERKKRKECIIDGY
jgi:hypothetical protein